MTFNSKLISHLGRRLAPFGAVAALVLAMGGTWTLRAASAAPPPRAGGDEAPAR